MSWQMTLLGILTFGTAVALTHYVSLGSLLVYIGFLIELIVFGQNGMFGMSQAYLNEMYVVAVLLTALAFYASGQYCPAGTWDRTKDVSVLP